MTFCRMSRALLVQMNGLGLMLYGRRTHRCSFQLGHAGEHAASQPLVVMSRKNRSTMFSHDAEVGVKCMLNLGCLASHSCTAGCLWVA